MTNRLPELSNATPSPKRLPLSVAKVLCTPPGVIFTIACLKRAGNGIERVGCHEQDCRSGQRPRREARESARSKDALHSSPALYW